MEMFADEKDLLWQHTGPLACSDSEQLRVDKHATISHLTNRYSVSEKLVGCFVDVKIFSNTLKLTSKINPLHRTSVITANTSGSSTLNIIWIPSGKSRVH